MTTQRTSATSPEPWADQFRAAAEDATKSVALDADALLRRMPEQRPARSARWGQRPRQRWVAAALCAAVAASVLVVGGVLGPFPGLGLGADPAAAAVDVRDTGADYTITFGNLGADPEEIRAALQQQGVDIAVEFVPASPSLVGTYTSLRAENDAGAGITVIYREGSEEAQDLVSMTIPKDDAPDVTLELGRRARGDEQYVSAATSAGLPGEALHCVPLNGRVRDLLPALRATGVELMWRTRGEADQVSDNDYIDAAIPWSRNTVLISTSQVRPDYAAIPPSFTRLLQQGC